MRWFLRGPLTLSGVVALVLLLMLVGWLAESADYGLILLYENHGPWAVRAVLLGGAAGVLLWALAARRGG